MNTGYLFIPERNHLFTRNILKWLFREKEKNYGPVRKRGGGNPSPQPKYIFFLIREKRSRKFWNEKICILMKFEKYVFISDYSGSLDKNIENDIKKTYFFQKSAKNGCYVRARKAQNVIDRSVTFRFFLRLPIPRNFIFCRIVYIYTRLFVMQHVSSDPPISCNSGFNLIQM